jgi:hypothetical protein
MRVGLSFSRCIRDIVDGKVNIDDVLVIISRTNFDPRDDKNWQSIWDGYHYGNMNSAPEWQNYPNSSVQFRDLTLELWRKGKLHQPRQFGAYPPRRKEIWLEVILPSEELDSIPFVRDAWENFQVAAALTGVKLLEVK